MLEFLFGPINPTKRWQQASNLQLDFNIESGAINGVKLSEPLERLSFLGPVEDQRGLSGAEYRYFSLGLSVSCCSRAGAISAFELVEKDPFEPRYLSYSGRCHWRGRSLTFANTSEQSILDDLGSPYWRDQDDDEIILFYEFPTMEWQIEFDLDHTFNRIIVTSKPIMCDQRQREAYGVTRPWPPKQSGIRG